MAGSDASSASGEQQPALRLGDRTIQIPRGLDLLLDQLRHVGQMSGRWDEERFPQIAWGSLSFLGKQK